MVILLCDSCVINIINPTPTGCRKEWLSTDAVGLQDGRPERALQLDGAGKFGWPGY